jgi:proteasome lid subunit RPN8/RPN11
MIKIDEEIRKKYKIQPPPQNIIFEYGKKDIGKYMQEKGFTIESMHSLNCREERIETVFQEELDFYIKEEACEKILEHCHSMALKDKEAMGFLIGDIKYWNGLYSIVYDIATASLDASPVYVRFRREAFEEIFDKLDEIGYEYVMVGWYHSHLGYSSFMSSIDLDTQKKYFNQPFHAALVVDPITREMKAFRLIENECREIPYAIFK